jgi:UDP-N-acetylmuramoylalanine-D-glutamate ligase
MEGLANQKVLVLGLGVSGLSAANFCVARGA